MTPSERQSCAGDIASCASLSCRLRWRCTKQLISRPPVQCVLATARRGVALCVSAADTVTVTVGVTTYQTVIVHSTDHDR